MPWCRESVAAASLLWLVARRARTQGAFSGTRPHGGHAGPRGLTGVYRLLLCSLERVVVFKRDEEAQEEVDEEDGRSGDVGG